MKAVLMDEFGGLEVLKVGETDKPSPKEGEVLVKRSKMFQLHIISSTPC